MGDLGWQELFKEAGLCREQAYAPYSKFWVGAAALFEDGSVSAGCNVENASYGLAICAERAAIFRGVADGKRRLVAMAIVADSTQACAPCGACRQVMAEFGGAELWVRSQNLQGDQREWRLDGLLPDAFSKDAL